MKNRIFWKGLVCGIIVLFLGMSIIPIASSVSIEKEQSVISKNNLEGIEISGTMGEHGWYISDVMITLNFTVWYYHIFYKIDDGEWCEYTVPIIVGTDGQHTINIYCVDQEGNVEDVYCATFKIDKTAPDLVLTKETVGIFQMKFVATVSDVTSGVWRVEFYLDSQLLGIVGNAPYEWIWTGSGNHIVTATVFDWAGNSASSSISTPYVKSFSSQQINQLLQNLILRHLTIR